MEDKIIKALEFDIIKNKLAINAKAGITKERILNLLPYATIEEMNEALTISNEAMQLVSRYGNIDLYGFMDITEIVNASKIDVTLSIEDILIVLKQLKAVNSVLNYHHDASYEHPYLASFCNPLDQVKPLANEIERCIHDHGEIKDDASHMLTYLRRQLVNVELVIKQKLDNFMRQHKNHIAEDVVTIRNDRFVILLKASSKNIIKGMVQGVSASGQTIYFEPDVIIEKNNELQEVKVQIEEEIRKILFDLSQKIKENEASLLNNTHLLTEIDFMFAKGILASSMSAVVANITEEYEGLSFKRAVHPLLDKKTAIANDIIINNEQTMLLITGSNAGGKTVTLKTVGLLCLMSFCGLLIPCEKAIIPLFENIFVDIGDQQSIVASLSTFSGHMKNLVDITNKVNHKSLVLLDELGSGTDPHDGESLSIAILDYLASTKAIVIATTHYSGLKIYAKEKDFILPASVEFNLETMMPTYILHLNTVGQSNALNIAKKLGLKQSIINDANRLREESESEQQKLLNKLTLEQEELNKKQQEVDSLVAEYHSRFNDLTHKETDLINQQNNIINNAKKEANEIVSNSRQQVNHLLNSLAKRKEKVEKEERINIEKALKEAQYQVIESQKEHEYLVGDLVQLTTTNKNAVVETVAKDHLIVLMGSISIKVKRNEVIFIAHKEKTKTNIKTTKTKKHVPLSLNIVGHRVAEAMPLLDKYLDDALLSKVPFVTIIHGVGTGTLRKAVHNHLNSNKNIASYRLGDIGEGHTGATIVYFK